MQIFLLPMIWSGSGVVVLSVVVTVVVVLRVVVVIGVVAWAPDLHTNWKPNPRPGSSKKSVKKTAMNLLDWVRVTSPEVVSPQNLKIQRSKVIISNVTFYYKYLLTSPQPAVPPSPWPHTRWGHRINTYRQTDTLQYQYFLGSRWPPCSTRMAARPRCWPNLGGTPPPPGIGQGRWMSW